MALEKFIRTIWAARLQSNLQKALIYGQPGIINRDYEGEARRGQTVKIGSIGPVTIGDYTKNVDHAPPETLTDEERALVIDQQKMFNFQVDDIDQVQGNPAVMDEAMREAAYGLADVADSFIASKMVSDAAASNAIGSTAAPVTLTVADKNAYSTLLKLRTALNKANVPTRDRWTALPPEWVELLLEDSRFAAAGSDELLNGVVGRAAGFNIVESNNTVKLSGADAGKHKVVAGSPLATTFADQIEELYPYRPERRFGDAVKGLQVYGAKVTRPAALAVATVRFA